MKFEDKDLPGLFQSADTASIKEQQKFFNGIFWYLILLIVAALFAFVSDFVVAAASAVAAVASEIVAVATPGKPVVAAVAGCSKPLEFSVPDLDILSAYC